MNEEKGMIKKLFYALILVTMALTFAAGCSKKESKARITGRAGGRAAPAPTTGSGGTIVGGVPGHTGQTGQIGFNNDFPGRIYDDGFGTLQDGIDGYIAADGSDPEQVIGLVTQQGTGLFFGGTVNTGASLNGQIEILVWDSLALTNGGNGLVLPSLVVDSASSYINGSNITVVAFDDYGTMTFQGTNNNSIFQGTVTYRNNNGTSGTIGQFQIPTCQMFTCQ